MTIIPIQNVYFHGDSLFSVGSTPGWNFSSGAENPRTPDYIGTALTAEGLTAVGVYANGGASASQIDSDITANSANLGPGSIDTIVINAGLNGSENAATFKSNCETICTTIRGINTSVNIYFMMLYVTSSASATVQSRVTARNPEILELESGGTIDGVVRWDVEGPLNLNVFDADGIHQWADQRAYVGAIVTRLLQTLSGLMGRW